MLKSSAFISCVTALLLIAAIFVGGYEINRNAAFFSSFFSANAGALPTAPVEKPQENFTRPTQITQPTVQPSAPEAVVSFSAEDLELLQIRYQCSYRPDLKELLCRKRVLSLEDDGPAVLIVHTHATESYCDTADRADYRSLDPEKNMISIGAEVARVLEMAGIRVIHDTTLFDYPDYSGAYTAARERIAAYLAAYPSLRLVLDLHRDAASSSGSQLITSATAGGQSCSQLLMVVGTDEAGASHPHWQDNLSLALQLSVLLEQDAPGITRPLSLRQKHYNLDLCPGSLLVEVGAAGDRHSDALLAANALANAILVLVGK